MKQPRFCLFIQKSRMCWKKRNKNNVQKPKSVNKTTQSFYQILSSKYFLVIILWILENSLGFVYIFYSSLCSLQKRNRSLDWFLLLLPSFDVYTIWVISKLQIHEMMDILCTAHRIMGICSISPWWPLVIEK